ncbi:DUF4190 domain-containing protein [uncultured Ruminococcus sp.]|uniref:DUF4190 domain-containing protein n=1 Tax=uncultured Ruminococcus sp. TaxID=165186 RepID=UPI002626D802|nr:DUF4190 domain-containing protein [uncultured Ruminococcus sp.]
MDNNYNNDPNNNGQSGYSNAQNGYDNQSGYSNAQNGYDNQGDYSNAQNGYNNQGGYSNAQNGYNNQGGYNNGQGQNYSDPYGSPQNYGGAPDFYGNLNNSDPFNDNSGKATASMVCGIISLVLWCIPIAGLALGIVAVTLGTKSKDSMNGGRAKAGFIMGCIGLGLSVINWIAGTILALR